MSALELILEPIPKLEKTFLHKAIILRNMQYTWSK